MVKKVIRLHPPSYTVNVFIDQSELICNMIKESSRRVVCIQLPLLGEILKFHYHHKMYDFLLRNYKKYPEFLNKLSDKYDG